MKTIGLIGGMSWQSTVDYYKYINLEVNKILGGNHSAQILLKSLDFGVIEKLQKDNNWDELSYLITSAGMDLEIAGADMVLICANTMHKVYDELKFSLSIPILHIANATIEEVKKRDFHKNHKILRSIQHKTQELLYCNPSFV